MKKNLLDNGSRLFSKMELLEHIVTVGSEFTVKIKEILKESNVLSDEEQQKIIERIRDSLTENFKWIIDNPECEGIRPLLESKVIDIEWQLDELEERTENIDHENRYKSLPLSSDYFCPYCSSWNIVGGICAQCGS